MMTTTIQIGQRFRVYNQFNQVIELASVTSVHEETFVTSRDREWNLLPAEGGKHETSKHASNRFAGQYAKPVTSN